jgi:hypothetical protein
MDGERHGTIEVTGNLAFQLLFGISLVTPSHCVEALPVCSGRRPPLDLTNTQVFPFPQPGCPSTQMVLGPKCRWHTRARPVFALARLQQHSICASPPVLARMLCQPPIASAQWGQHCIWAGVKRNVLYNRMNQLEHTTTVPNTPEVARTICHD